MLYFSELPLPIGVEKRPTAVLIPVLFHRVPGTVGAQYRSNDELECSTVVTDYST